MSTDHLLRELGVRVADDGVAAHHVSLVELARLTARLNPGAAAVLRDATAPDVVRARALAVASRSLTREVAAPAPAAAA